MSAPKADEYGFYRVHAIDGSGQDYSTRDYDPEIHVIADGPATDYRGRPLAAGMPVSSIATEPEAPSDPDKAPATKLKETQK